MNDVSFSIFFPETLRLTTTTRKIIDLRQQNLSSCHRNNNDNQRPTRFIPFLPTEMSGMRPVRLNGCGIITGVESDGSEIIDVTAAKSRRRWTRKCPLEANCFKFDPVARWPRMTQLARRNEMGWKLIASTEGLELCTIRIKLQLFIAVIWISLEA